MIMLFLSCGFGETSHTRLPSFKQIELQIETTLFTVGWAETPHEQALGLRYRNVGLNDGLLLPVNGGEVHMDGMQSPISAALLSSDGRIKQLWQLEMDAPPKTIPDDGAYLLEMHDTWFVRHQIKRDMRVLGIPNREQK